MHATGFPDPRPTTPRGLPRSARPCRPSDLSTAGLTVGCPAPCQLGSCEKRLWEAHGKPPPGFSRLNRFSRQWAQQEPAAEPLTDGRRAEKLDLPARDSAVEGDLPEPHHHHGSHGNMSSPEPPVIMSLPAPPKRFAFGRAPFDSLRVIVSSPP